MASEGVEGETGGGEPATWSPTGVMIAYRFVLAQCATDIQTHPLQTSTSVIIRSGAERARQSVGL